MTGNGVIRRLAHELPRGDRLSPAVWERRHRALAALVLVHVALLPLFALARGYALPQALLEGAILPAALALAGLRLPVGRRGRAALVASGLVACSGVLVHFAGGATEAHFHVFAVLLLLSLYEDWVPLGLAVGVVLGYQALAGALAPGLVFDPDGRRHATQETLVHAAAIVFFVAISVFGWRLNDALRRERDAREEELERANAELRELDRVRSEFVAVASHELRTPLTSVLGFATTLRERWDSVPDEERRAWVGIIEEQGVRLARLVGDLLDLSRIGSGTLPVRAERVDLRPVVEKVDDQVGIGVSVVGDAHATAWADPGHVEQIVLNLLGNARKHGEAPYRVELRAGTSAVELRVRDSGPGVPSEFVGRLFDSFSQADPETGDGGTGLGLAIVLGLAELNDGTAWYEEGGRDEGATFAVRLPAAAYGSGRYSTTGESRSAVVQPPTA